MLRSGNRVTDKLRCQVEDEERFYNRQDLEKQEECHVVVHERVTEPRATSLSDLPAFNVGSYG